MSPPSHLPSMSTWWWVRFGQEGNRGGSRISDLTWLNGDQGSNGRLLGIVHHRDGANSKIQCFPGTFGGMDWKGKALVRSGAFYCTVAKDDSTANALANWNLKSLHFKWSQVSWAITTFPFREERCHCSVKNSHTQCFPGLNINQHPRGLSVATSVHSKCHTVRDLPIKRQSSQQGPGWSQQRNCLQTKPNLTYKPSFLFNSWEQGENHILLDQLP